MSSTSLTNFATLGAQFGSAELTQSGLLTVAALLEPSTVAMMLADQVFLQCGGHPAQVRRRGP